MTPQQDVIETLKPCPFCGERARYEVTTDGRLHWVECTECQAETHIDKTKEQAIAAWNRRAQAGDAESAHTWLDQQGAPREDVWGELSIVGRIRRLLKAQSNEAGVGQ